MQVEFGLKRDLPGFLGYAALAAGEVHDRFVDAGQRDLNAEIVQLRADAWPFAEKMGRGREIIGRQRGQDQERRGAHRSARSRHTGGAGACAPCDGAEASPGDASAASAADPANRMTAIEPATPRTSIAFPSWTSARTKRRTPWIAWHGFRRCRSSSANSQERWRML